MLAEKGELRFEKSETDKCRTSEPRGIWRLHAHLRGNLLLIAARNHEAVIAGAAGVLARRGSGDWVAVAIARPSRRQEGAMRERPSQLTRASHYSSRERLAPTRPPMSEDSGKALEQRLEELERRVAELEKRLEDTQNSISAWIEVTAPHKPNEIPAAVKYNTRVRRP